MRRRVVFAVSAVALLISPSAALGAWTQVVGGENPINFEASRAATALDAAVVGGVPHVAWAETPVPGVSQIHVARLSADGTDWQEIGAGPTPVNIDPTRAGVLPAIADVGGVPYVAYLQDTVAGNRVRVVRLNSAGSAWEVVGDALDTAVVPVSQGPDIVAVGGVPHVAWIESNGVSLELRVARLSGNTWLSVGGGPVDGALMVAANFRPAIAAIARVPWVAWTHDEGGGSREVRVSRLNAAGTGWEEPEGGANPIGASALNPSTGVAAALVAVGGVPHVAWQEADDVGQSQVRVSRLNAAGTDWAEPVGGRGPVNENARSDAGEPSLADVGGVPWVAWVEDEPVGSEVRVARLSSNTDDWEQPVGGAHPISASELFFSSSATVMSVGGFPWVAWREEQAGGSNQARASRLEPELSVGSAVSTSNGATLTTSMKTFGLPFQTGFTMTGPGGSDTGLSPASGDPALIVRTVSGLTPSTAYTFRPFATAGVPVPRILGPEAAFTTLVATPTPPPAPAVPALLLQRLERGYRAKAGKRLRIRYVASRGAQITVTVLRGTRRVRTQRATARVGLNGVTITVPRVAGRYVVRLAGITADKKTATIRVNLTVAK